MMNYVIGIAGEKNSGKDTVATMINYIFAKGVTQANYSDYVISKAKYDNTYADRIYHFADPLKQVLSIMYNIPIECFYDRKYKDDYWYCFNIGNFLDTKTVEKSKYNIIDIKCLNNNSIKEELANHIFSFSVIRLRTLMQYFGTDVCRNNLQDDIWVRSALGKIIDKAHARRVCIVPDVRFANEANALKIVSPSLYGGVIRISRDSCEKNEHSSETIDFNCDYNIDNNKDLRSLFYKVLQVIQDIINTKR